MSQKVLVFSTCLSCQQKMKLLEGNPAKPQSWVKYGNSAYFIEISENNIDENAWYKLLGSAHILNITDAWLKMFDSLDMVQIYGQSGPPLTTKIF